MPDKIRTAGKYDSYSHMARNIRDMEPGKGRANLDKEGRAVSESTHLMTSSNIDDRNVVFPTLFPHKTKPNRWIDYDKGDDVRGAYDEARSRGEVFEFGQDEKEARKFAKGSWKAK